MAKIVSTLAAIRLSDAQIAEYQGIYQRAFGEAISKEDALVQGLALVRLVNVISQVDEYEKEQHRERVSANNS